jgi:hypothetical protein
MMRQLKVSLQVGVSIVVVHDGHAAWQCDESADTAEVSFVRRIMRIMRISRVICIAARHIHTHRRQ